MIGKLGNFGYKCCSYSTMRQLLKTRDHKQEWKIEGAMVKKVRKNQHETVRSNLQRCSGSVKAVFLKPFLIEHLWWLLMKPFLFFSFK